MIYNYIYKNYQQYLLLLRMTNDQQIIWTLKWNIFLQLKYIVHIA